MEKNCGERKKPGGMAFVGGWGAGQTGMDGAIFWPALIKSPYGPDEDK